jgi:hypothetical protein
MSDPKMRYRYWTDPASPASLPHVFTLEGQKWGDLIEVRSWCITQFGAPGGYFPDSDTRWCASSGAVQRYGDGAILFRDDCDATHFRLRWC